MKTKTHTTAVVLIPPQALWEPIQAIRHKHDRQVRRWMPHITLLYPFLPLAEFDAVAQRLAQACARIEPFELRLEGFRHFDHGGESFTVWLAPEPSQAVVNLQEALWRVVPKCDDVRRLVGGFTPHLSVGQVRGRAALEALLAELQRGWRPLSFAVHEVCLIYRFEPPDDVFRVSRAVPLGRSPAG